MNKLEPIGSELSINAKACPDLTSFKKGDEIELCVKVKKIGEHTHSLGKTERMIDVEILEIEVDKENEDGQE